MFIGMGFYNLCNLLYHFFMVRTLPPAEYGHLNSLLALFMVISVPANTVQTSIAKFVSSFRFHQQSDWIRGFLRHLLWVMSSVAFSIFLLFALGSSLTAFFLQISSRLSVILLGVALLFGMVLPVPWGGLQGLQQFGWLSLNMILNGTLKLALGIILVLRGLGVPGAMGAVVVAYVVTVASSLSTLWISLPETEGRLSGRHDS